MKHFILDVCTATSPAWNDRARDYGKSFYTVFEDWGYLKIIFYDLMHL